MVALLASLTPMCLIVWRGITGDAVHKLEIIGVLLAMAGGVISTVGEGGGDDGADVGTVSALRAPVQYLGFHPVPICVVMYTRPGRYICFSMSS